MLSRTQSNLAPFVERLVSRSILSEAERAAILRLPVHVRQVRPNEDFVALGARVDHACFVVEGLVGRFDQNGNGDRQITALHIAGDMPDLHSVVQPTATSALQALSTSTIIEGPMPRCARSPAPTRQSPRRSGAIAWSMRWCSPNGWSTSAFETPVPHRAPAVRDGPSL